MAVLVAAPSGGWRRRAGFVVPAYRTCMDESASCSSCTTTTATTTTAARASRCCRRCRRPETTQHLLVETAHAQQEARQTVGCRAPTATGPVGISSTERRDPDFRLNTTRIQLYSARIMVEEKKTILLKLNARQKYHSTILLPISLDFVVNRCFIKLF